MVVTGRAEAAAFNRGSMGTTTAISARELATFASIQRNLQDYARTDPRLAQTDKERGEISAGGQNTRFNSITIDGVTTNDTFGLESNNLPTLKQPISKLSPSGFENTWTWAPKRSTREAVVVIGAPQAAHTSAPGSPARASRSTTGTSTWAPAMAARTS